MFWTLALLATGTASAWDDPNRMATVHVAVVHALGQSHPWGVRVGADGRYALGDHCTYREHEIDPDCRVGGVWPVAGPAGSITWRGGTRFAFEVDGLLGVGGLDMAQFGFLPMWEVVARLGVRVETPGPVPSLALGGFAAKSFGLTVHVAENTTTTRGTHALGLRLDADTAWAFGGPLPLPTLAGGVWMVVTPTYSFF